MSKSKGDKMRSLQMISILALAMVAISLSVAEALEKTTVEKDRAEGCVICSDDQ
jgi:hypothetical protein